MQLYTFKARSIAEALKIVRAELGPDASLLHSREVGSPLARLFGMKELEITASAEIAAPSRLPEMHAKPAVSNTTAESHNSLQNFRQNLRLANQTETSLVEKLSAS